MVRGQIGHAQCMSGLDRQRQGARLAHHAWHVCHRRGRQRQLPQRMFYRNLPGTCGGQEKLRFR